MANNIIKTKDQDELIKCLCERIEKAANSSIAEKDKFTIGLSGGSLVDFLCSGLPNITTDWSKWVFLFCDERLVKPEDNDSTFGLYKTRLLPHIKVDENQFIIVDHELSPAECAESYSNKLRAIFKTNVLPKIDMVLLGMGPDGHTCSLFPGHIALAENSKWVVEVEDSPKPPPKRITLTFPVINNAGACIFALSGRGKAEMIKRILEDHEDLPASRVNGALWILDSDAASLLK